MRDKEKSFKCHVLVFKENSAHTGTLSNTPFNIRGNHVLVHGTEKGFTSVFIHFHLFNYAVIIF